MATWTLCCRHSFTLFKEEEKKNSPEAFAASKKWCEKQRQWLQVYSVVRPDVFIYYNEITSVHQVHPSTLSTGSNEKW